MIYIYEPTINIIISSTNGMTVPIRAFKGDVFVYTLQTSQCAYCNPLVSLFWIYVWLLVKTPVCDKYDIYMNRQ